MPEFIRWFLMIEIGICVILMNVVAIKGIIDYFKGDKK